MNCESKKPDNNQQTLDFVKTGYIKGKWNRYKVKEGETSHFGGGMALELGRDEDGKY